MVESFEKAIGYEFKDKSLAITALTHTSYANENGKGTQSYERLEFLGDALLDLYIGEYLFNYRPILAEGNMSKIRAKIVCAASIAECSKKLNLGNLVQLGKGEKRSGGSEKQSILADLFESTIAAIYLDSGFESAKEFTVKNLLPLIRQHLNDEYYDEYKTVLQELVQKESNSCIEYVLLEETGPVHERKFLTQVSVNGQVLGRGKGSTKKESENMAAKEAIEILKSK